MDRARTQRRLAAVLAADVVGYSRLMEQDESGTMMALRVRRKEILEPVVRRHQGRIFKLTGDGVLVEFGSAIDAVECAVDLQQEMAAANRDSPSSRAITLRIGINLGDVIVEGSDLYGDGINVASRLEGLAEPGGICVSRNVYDQVKRKVEFGFDERGAQAVKNISEPMNVYSVRFEAAAKQQYDGPQQKTLPLPAKPSIAVLPFTNMSYDPEHESFADGLTEDLITELSRNTGLFVIARHSSFAYKGRSVDVRQIAKDLGVRYLLEGSARRASGRVRVNVQLIDSVGGDHLWADRFDRILEDIFAVQDEVTAKIVEGLVGRLTAAPARNRPKTIEAYDLCVRARILISQTQQEAREARILLERAIVLDPEYAEAHRWLAMHLLDAWTFWGEPEEPNRRLAVELAVKAVALDPNDAGCRWALGRVLAYEKRWPEGESEFAAAIQLDPNYADAWAHLSDITMFSGRPIEAIEQVQKALRLNPHPPGWYYWFLGSAQYGARQYANAVETLRKDETYRTASRRLLAASLAQLGRIEEARQEAELFMLSNPRFTTSHWARTQPFRDEKMREHFVNGYRKAGLPE